MKETANIYYRKNSYFIVPNEIDMKDYELVCKYPIYRAPGHKDDVILETLFSLFNWVEEGFQPNDPAIGFNRPETVRHTSMSVGDVIEISGIKYVCGSFGWNKVEAVE
jgi:hypothetical protein